MSFQIREPESSFELKSTSATNIIFNFQFPPTKCYMTASPFFSISVKVFLLSFSTVSFGHSSGLISEVNLPFTA